MGVLEVRQGSVVAANSVAAYLIGCTAEELTGSTVGAWLMEAPGQRTRLLEQVLAGKCSETVEATTLRRRADGISRSLLVASVPCGESDDPERPVFVSVCAVSDHSPSILREGRAQASLQRVLETAPMAMALFEWPSCCLLQLNQLAAEFLGGSLENLSGRPPERWQSTLAPEGVADLRASLELACEFPTGVRREVTRSGAPGSAPRVWDMRLVSAHADDDSGVVQQQQILLVATEVTDLRVAEQERFDAAIAQRGMLVQEVHHRIKNNLQGVAGLLQQASSRFPEVAPILADAVGQLQAIAQVYGLQVGTSGPVGLAGLVTAVAASVQKTFHHPIEVQVAGEEPQRWRLPEAESIPVALTANELLTNAIKHGAEFPVSCRFTAGAADVALEIASRGRLREGFDPASVASGASGLGLVRALLPRRASEFSLRQVGDEVVARVVLRPPAVRKDG